MSKLTKLLAVPLIAFGINQGIKSQDSTKVKEPVVTGNFSSKLVSKHLILGYIVGEGPNKEDLLNFNCKNFNAFVWSNYDIGKSAMTEIDLGLGYSKKLNEKTSANVGLTRWTYPQGSYDDVISGSLTHSGKLDKTLSLYYLFENKNTAKSQAVNLNISRNIKLSKNFSLTPSVETSYLNNVYGGDKGFSELSASANLNYSNKNINFSVFSKGQLGLMQKNPSGIPIKNYASIGANLSVNF
jgi:hypothetical protein